MLTNVKLFFYPPLRGGGVGGTRSQLFFLFQKEKLSKRKIFISSLLRDGGLRGTGMPSFLFEEKSL